MKDNQQQRLKVTFVSHDNVPQIKFLNYLCDFSKPGDTLQHSTVIKNNPRVLASVNNQDYAMQCYETLSVNNFTRIQSLIFDSTDVFMLLFSPEIPETLDHILSRLPKLKNDFTNAKFVLVGVYTEASQEVASILQRGRHYAITEKIFYSEATINDVGSIKTAANSAALTSIKGMNQLLMDRTLQIQYLLPEPSSNSTPLTYVAPQALQLPAQPGNALTLRHARHLTKEATL